MKDGKGRPPVLGTVRQYCGKPITFCEGCGETEREYVSSLGPAAFPAKIGVSPDVRCLQGFFRSVQLMNPCSHEHVFLREQLEEDPARVLTEQFLKHRARLTRIVQFRLRSILAARVDVDDVFQDAWLAAYQRLPHFLNRESISMFTWLRLIVCQTIVDLHRHHLGAGVRDVHREVVALQPGCSAATSQCIASQLIEELATPSQMAMHREFASQLECAINSMDSIDREVLAMRHFEELSNREVAEALEISEQTASIRYIRAVKRLKVILKV